MFGFFFSQKKDKTKVATAAVREGGHCSSTWQSINDDSTQRCSDNKIKGCKRLGANIARV